jgi:hypothetical protein
MLVLLCHLCSVIMLNQLQISDTTNLNCELGATWKEQPLIVLPNHFYQTLYGFPQPLQATLIGLS